MKGQYIGFAWYENDGYKSPTYEYEYRGMRYNVTDHRNGYSETMKQQHEYNQNRIDSILDSTSISTEDAQVGFDLFWDYVNGDGE